jgi:thiosulfate dehydrogenase [quinone] large subunit
MAYQSSLETPTAGRDLPMSGQETAIEPPAGIFSRAGLAAVRVVLGLMWLDKVGARMPPDFNGLTSSIGAGDLGSGSDPLARLMRSVITPNVELLGWIILTVEVALGVFLILGLTTRLWAGVGVIQSLVILATVAGSRGVWAWTYILMAAAHVAVLASAAGRTFGLDGLLRPGWIASRPRALSRFS